MNINGKNVLTKMKLTVTKRKSSDTMQNLQDSLSAPSAVFDARFLSDSVAS